MDQPKIGRFLRELRTARGLTQEQLAQVVGVSNRSVSRWETGVNLPDLDILIELADYYEVDLRDILRGERKREEMDQETKEAALQAAEYAGEQTSRLSRRVRVLALIGAALWALSQLISHTPLDDVRTLRIIADFCEGATCGTLLCCFITASKQGKRIRAFKKRLLGRGCTEA